MLAISFPLNTQHLCKTGGQRIRFNKLSESEYGLCTVPFNKLAINYNLFVSHAHHVNASFAQSRPRTLSACVLTLAS